MTTVSNATHRLVTIDQLSIDPSVQRKEGVQQGRAEKMAASLNPDALGALTLSEREDGKLIVLDGAHRAEACRIAGYRGPLHALVYTGLTVQQEAVLFVLLNDFKQPSFVSRMLARVIGGDVDASAIVASVQRHGWAIGFSSENGNYAALAAAERVYRNAAGALAKGPHPEVLDRTLAVITAAWRHDRESAHQMITLGLGQVIGRYGDAVDLQAMGNRLAQERPNVIIGKARALQSMQGGTVPAAVAKVIVGIYNHRRRTNLLPEWIWTN